MKTILASDVKSGRRALPKPMGCLNEIGFTAVSQQRRLGRLIWRVEFTPTQLRRVVRAAVEGSTLRGENETLRAELEQLLAANQALQAANEQLIVNMEHDAATWQTRKAASEARLTQILNNEGSGSVRTCSGGLPSLGRR